jgi:DNA-binding NtrC family response regulator
LHKRHFDAVVTDYRMPFLNGLELVRLIHIHYPLIPVILVSGSHPVRDELVLSDCRPLGWLKKPYDRGSLLKLVQSAVNQQRVACNAEVECQPIADVG